MLANQDVSGKKSPLGHTGLPPTSTVAANITITVSNQHQMNDDQDQRNMRFGGPPRPMFTRKPKPRCGGYYPQPSKVVAPQQLPRQPLQMPVAPLQLTSSSFKPYRMQQPVNLQIPKIIPQVRMVPKYPKQDHL
ncbi:hypothetical protein K1T71_000447 [Dendrolimus kikuchii]|uniref:Uncharacterized protein n=1 Tax=Dendrolimus kikuchii TaxID=765133 RepID=A0ACC1DJ62_9NEOP|nr:hypothetical protein K1T71_000447 [Dendrolimus kikuchii]